jgi:hypothetical protein
MTGLYRPCYFMLQSCHMHRSWTATRVWWRPKRGGQPLVCPLQCLIGRLNVLKDDRFVGLREKALEGNRGVWSMAESNSWPAAVVKIHWQNRTLS